MIHLTFRAKTRPNNPPAILYTNILYFISYVINMVNYSKRNKFIKYSKIKGRHHGGGIHYKDYIPQFCGKTSIIKKKNENCDKVNLIKIDISNKIEESLDILELLLREHNKIHFKSTNKFIKFIETEMKKKDTFVAKENWNLTKNNISILNGFYSLFIDQEKKSKDGTLVYMNSKILKKNINPGNLKKYIDLGKHSGSEVCKARGCYRFNKGIGAQALNIELKKEFSKGKQYILLHPSGESGLIKYYKTIGLRGPLEFNFPSGKMLIMYGKLEDVIHQIDRTSKPIQSSSRKSRNNAGRKKSPDITKKISFINKMYPQYDIDLIEQILHDKKGNINLTIDSLNLKTRLSSSGPKASASRKKHQI